MPQRYRLLAALVVAVLAATPLAACSIPVFRYALERWRAERAHDLYTVVVFHRGPLSSEPAAALAVLQQLGDDTRPRANFLVEAVDVAGPMNAPQRKLWETQQKAALPWMVLRYPDSTDKTPSAWAGPLHAANVQLLTESPARREIAERILRGESVVWLLLEVGDKARDDAAEKVLRAELARLEKVVELPEGLGEGPVKLLSDLPVRVAFSVLRVRREDPAEQALIGMLLQSEEELAEIQEPMAFPVFGRGRFLDPHLGKGINGETLHERCQFLCSACSCRVKRLNPGTDLLMTVDWDARLDTPIEQVPEKQGIEGKLVPIAPGSRQEESASDEAANFSPEPFESAVHISWFGVGLVSVGLLLLIGLAVAVWTLDSKPRGGE